MTSDYVEKVTTLDCEENVAHLTPPVLLSFLHWVTLLPPDWGRNTPDTEKYIRKYFFIHSPLIYLPGITTLTLSNMELSSSANLNFFLDVDFLFSLR